MEPLYKQVGTDWQTEELAVFHCDYDGKLPEMNLNMNFILKTLVYRYRASLISDRTSGPITKLYFLPENKRMYESYVFVSQSKNNNYSFI